ncbi:GMP synthase [uncultured Shewanella sp.]|uniref:glutamine amidotransferase-related protein n=1 Tax=uncultured Shewanella sp. TaxID=173975 RepID=UPI00263A11AE|nr:GMP synthase [uncultured Shewanella sp.]
MKIGLLLCDVVREHFQVKHGGYPQMFTHLFASCQQNDAIELVFYAVLDGHYPQEIDECDGYIISGSRACVNDDEAWIHALEDYVHQLNERQKKCVGICFGHQMIAKALGGKVERSDKGWGLGVMACQLMKIMPWMAKNRNGGDLSEVSLVMSHQDQVICLPDSASVLASSEFCSYGMFQLGSHFLGIQGHPEFSTDYCHDLIKLRSTILSAELVNSSFLSLKVAPDATWMAQSIVNFFAAD